MLSHPELDGKLIAEEVRLGGHRTKKTAVTRALTEYFQLCKQRAILDLFGKIDLLPK